MAPTIRITSVSTQGIMGFKITNLTNSDRSTCVRTILGIRHGHDAAASLVIDGQIVADIAEERLTRKKNDGSFPENAIRFCLDYAGITSRDLDAVAVSTTSISATIRTFFPGSVVEKGGEKSFKSQILKKLFPGHLPEEKKIDLPVYYEVFPVSPDCKIIPVHHHLAHAASAYFTAGDYDQKALVVVMDGRGDGFSTSLWRGERNSIELLQKYDGSSSLAWFYSAVTESLDWRHGSDEWKTMGLAPYGTPKRCSLEGFFPEFANGKLTRPHAFGEPERFPDHGTNHYHLDDAVKIKTLLSSVSREDLASEAQRIVEEQAEEIIYPWLKKEGTRKLCCAGGFFLNVKFNQRVWYSGNVDEHWIFPNPGDSGTAAGAALYVYYTNNQQKKPVRLKSLYLGPEYSDEEIKKLLDHRKLSYEYCPDIVERAAKILAQNYIIGWFQGRMESGPRALGHRSILMSPLKAENKDTINACVKYREAFRPFTPSIIAEKLPEYLIDSRDEPFMITSFGVVPEKKAKIPAVVHIDGTARPQAVHRDINPLYYDLIKKFGGITGESVILNTSFNVKGEPIVCNPRDAIKCFMDTGLDYLFLGKYLLKKQGRL